MFVNTARVKWYITVPCWSNKSFKGRWDVVESSVFTVNAVGCSCLENELTGGMCRLKGNMNLKLSVTL